MQESREMGLYPLWVVYAFSGFPGLGMMVISALRKERGWYPTIRHPRKRSVMYSPMAGQASCRRATDMPSAPGAVLPEPVVAFLASGSDTVWSQGMCLLKGRSVSSRVGVFHVFVLPVCSVVGSSHVYRRPSGRSCLREVILVRVDFNDDFLRGGPGGGLWRRAGEW
ncbi:hypothetical protein GGI42DRAFT_218930 [Trichoderma sp. SZMC 28013]